MSSAKAQGSGMVVRPASSSTTHLAAILRFSQQAAGWSWASLLTTREPGWSIASKCNSVQLCYVERGLTSLLAFHGMSVKASVGNSSSVRTRFWARSGTCLASTAIATAGGSTGTSLLILIGPTRWMIRGYRQSIE